MYISSYIDNYEGGREGLLKKSENQHRKSVRVFRPAEVEKCQISEVRIRSGLSVVPRTKMTLFDVSCKQEHKPSHAML
ncbi:hypothetical protein NQZ68_015638 [Dissostichus eleginoides]|nr:hypothetical protein NQZ68_015638 [Dissostichus eleginoides]